MQYVNGLIGTIFVILALLHVPHPTPFIWLPYAGAALLAFITLRGGISVPLARVLAVCTALLMFYFFAGFFALVPNLEADWYQAQAGWLAVSLILAAFTMIPVLSDYSCRLKADCREARQRQPRHFFSVPDHIRPRH